MTSPIDSELAPTEAGARLPSLGSPEVSPEFLSRVKEVLEILLGRRGGSNWDRAVTFRDLYQLGVNAGDTSGFGGALVAGSQSNSGLIGGFSAYQATKFDQMLRASSAYKELSRGIGSMQDLAGFPEEIRQQLQLALASVARERKADIQTVTRKVQTSAMSVASQLQEITASLEQTAAGVRQFDAAYADSVRAVAVSIKQVAASIGNLGDVTVEEKFLAQADINEGLLGQWSIKIQTGTAEHPIIAGIALSAEGPTATETTSSLVFMADRFGFFTNNGTVLPFGIDGATNTIYVNGQLVVGAGGKTLNDLANGSINYVGEFAAPPDVASYKVNDLYKNTANGSTYILKLSNGAKVWTVWLAKGSDGNNGSRGTVDIAAGGYSSWNNAAANAVLAAAGYSGPQNRDRVTLYGAGFSETRFYDAGNWLTLAAYINGNMLVDGTLSASKVSGGILDGVIVRFGSGHTLNNRAFEITSGNVVWADNLFGGSATFSNSYYSSHALSGWSDMAGYCGVVGQVAPGNSSGSSHGVIGANLNKGTSGIIGQAGAFDFYADGSGTNYGPFTGAHEGLVLNGQALEVGDLVLDVDCVGQRGYSNSIFTMERSSEPYQRGVRGPVAVIMGPLQDYAPAAMVEGVSHTVDADGNPVKHQIMSGSYYDMADTHTVVAVNSLGEGSIKVCGQGGPIGPDDLLVTSSIPGVAMRQNVGQLDDGEADDLVRRCTVAKARVGKGKQVTFTDSNEVQVIPCIYLGG